MGSVSLLCYSTCLLIFRAMHCLAYLVLLCILVTNTAKKASDKPDWAKKNIIDYTDADLERLLDQWDEDEEPIPADELPYGHPDRPQAAVDWSKVDMNNEGDVMKATKKWKTVMMFVRVNQFRNREETEEITALWEMGLFNNHVDAERTLMEDHTVMFLFRDGEAAWEAKEYLVNEERVEEVQLEGRHTKADLLRIKKTPIRIKKRKIRKKRRRKRVKRQKGRAIVVFKLYDKKTG